MTVIVHISPALEADKQAVSHNLGKECKMIVTVHISFPLQKLTNNQSLTTLERTL